MRLFGNSSATRTLLHCLRLLFLTSLVSAVHAAPSPQRAVLGADDARYFLNRTGFAPNAAEVAVYAVLTREQAVDKVLREAQPEARTPVAPEFADSYTPPSQYRGKSAEERRAVREVEIRHAFALRGWWLREMLATPSPLTERMTLFWHNHFVASQQKVRHSRLMYKQNVLLRRHALGNFSALLHAASKDPAMLIYLDNASNRKGSPNENFAREVMELFTLGEGNYKEQDIKEAARAFTGWSVEPETGEFRFRPMIHDTGDKTVLGKSGNFDGDAVLDILLAQPACAEYLTAKLWREFVSPTPDAAEVKRIAAKLRGSGYDIKAALGELFKSPAFWDPVNRGTLIKSPVELLVGTLKQFEFSYDDPLPFSFAVAQLGQNLFSPPNVKGWPGGDAWINSSSLLARKNVLERLFRAVELGKAQPAMAAKQPAPQMMDAAMQPGMDASTRPAAAARAQMAELGKVQGQGALGREGRIQFANAASAIRFNPSLFLAHYDAAPDSAPTTRQRLAIQQAVLPVPPTAPINSDLAGTAYLRMLVLDPAYQLK
ncbi:MAG TPA: DUF1800 domain-containing protein [Burkholderiaceae bacterium]